MFNHSYGCLFLLFCFLYSGGVSDSNTYGVIIASSVFFRNYRHVVNSLSIEKKLHNGGLGKSYTILFIAGDYQCNNRNNYYGHILSPEHDCDLINDTVVSYHGDDVSLDHFIGVLTNKLPSSIPAQKRLWSNSSSHLLLFLNGHGGENFFKIREREEITRDILFNVLNDMYAQGRYGRVLVIIDTCQASSLIPKQLPPQSVFLVSSKVGEESYSYGHDMSLGVPVQDRFINQLLQYITACSDDPQLSLSVLINSYLTYSHLQSTVVWKASFQVQTLCPFFL